jgi:hypothetical protein
MNSASSNTQTDFISSFIKDPKVMDFALNQCQHITISIELIGRLLCNMYGRNECFLKPTKDQVGNIVKLQIYIRLADVNSGKKRIVQKFFIDQENVFDGLKDYLAGSERSKLEVHFI